MNDESPKNTPQKTCLPALCSVSGAAGSVYFYFINDAFHSLFFLSLGAVLSCFFDRPKST